jgi:hypothetical protein
MYGSGAFYDLDTTGYQATLANNLTKGESCVVASLAAVGRIDFDWYKFRREIVKPDNKGVHCRALFGNHFKSATLSRDKAREDGIYSRFFDKNGNFKRHSVLRA